MKPGTQSLQHSKGAQEENVSLYSNSADSFSVLEPVNLGNMSFDNNLPIISVPDDFFDASIQSNDNRCSQLFSSIATENTFEDVAAVKNDSSIIEVIDNQIISAVDKDMIVLESVNDSIILAPISHSTPFTRLQFLTAIIVEKYHSFRYPQKQLKTEKQTDVNKSFHKVVLILIRLKYTIPTQSQIQQYLRIGKEKRQQKSFQ